MISAACGRPKITIKLPAASAAHPPQLVAAEEHLVDSIRTLQSKNCVFGQILTPDKLIKPIQENVILEDSLYAFPEGDKGIVAQVVHEQQVEQGKIIEVNESDSEDEVILLDMKPLNWC